MLDYDDSAFYYFSMTLLLIYLIPGTYYCLNEVHLAFHSGGDVGSTGRTSIEEMNKASKLRKASIGFNRLNKAGFISNFACLVLVYGLFFYLMSLVGQDGEVHSFDPYTILGLNNGATEAEIKKAYRKLSLLHHPDKNLGKVGAEELFMKTAKAYEALTDETSKENYEKYGNPDGKQALEVSIGLPKIILENPKVVLVLYLVGMVVVIPVAVAMWYSNSKKYGEKNIMYDTYRVLFKMMDEKTSMLGSLEKPGCCEILACSSEFRAINEKIGKKERPKPDVQKTIISKIMGTLKENKLMGKPLYDKNPVILYGNVLLHTHLLRMTDQLVEKGDETIVEDLNKMLKLAPELIEGMIEIAHQSRWLKTTLVSIKFSQHIKQALFRKCDPLEQIPHLTKTDREEIAKQYEGQDKSRVLNEYLHTAADKRSGLSKLTDAQRKDVDTTLSLIPCRDITYKLYVEEEEEEEEEENNTGGNGNKAEAMPATIDDVKINGTDIYQGDLVTLRVTVERKGFPKSKTAPLVLAPYFPSAIQENLWFILASVPNPKQQESILHNADKVGDAHNVIDKDNDTSVWHTVEHEMKFMAPQEIGTYEMYLYVCSDSYVGLDERFVISYDVKSAGELPEYVPHPEDVELENEPTLFEQVMAANQDEADSSDDEAEPVKPINAIKEKVKKSSNSKTVPVVVDSDDGSDSADDDTDSDEE